MKGEFVRNVVIDERYVEVSEDWREMGDASTHPLHGILPAKQVVTVGSATCQETKTHIIIYDQRNNTFLRQKSNSRP